MESTLLFIGLVVFFGLAMRGGDLFKPRQGPYPSKMPPPDIYDHYQACESLFVNRSELALFHCLTRSVPPNFFVLTKPRLEDIIRVKQELPNPKLRFSLRSRIKSRHVDFLIIDDQGRPHIAIELDGKSHRRGKAAAGDVLKNGVFQASGITLRRIQPGENFNAFAAKIMSEL